VYFVAATKHEDQRQVYGLRPHGRVLLVLQAVFITTFGLRGFGWIRGFENVLTELPAGVVSPLAAMLGAFALIAIFTTGLLLDLFGSWYFRTVEMKTFQLHAQRNEPWMRKLIHRHQDYIQDDWSATLNAPRLSCLKAMKILLGASVVWDTSARKKHIDPLRQSWACRQPY
jgi:hypothetical protein